ncbi:hypothetical protein QJS66_12105 [Kocuria rhizophila]|nr:hypothetical protein QJS66_12105 [Kocuria rhizophila]
MSDAPQTTSAHARRRAVPRRRPLTTPELPGGVVASMRHLRRVLLASRSRRAVAAGA